MRSAKSLRCSSASVGDGAGQQLSAELDVVESAARRRRGSSRSSPRSPPRRTATGRAATFPPGCSASAGRCRLGAPRPDRTFLPPPPIMIGGPRLLDRLRQPVEALTWKCSPVNVNGPSAKRPLRMTAVSSSRAMRTGAPARSACRRLRTPGAATRRRGRPGDDLRRGHRAWRAPWPARPVRGSPGRARSG